MDSIRQLMQVEKSEMTAFEFAKKIELLFRLMGPVYGRMEWEFLHRIVDITFALMLSGGDFSPPPPEVFDTDGVVDVEFDNPISRAQRSGGVEALGMAAQDLAVIGQVYPQVWDRIEPDKLSQYVVTTRGVPAKVTRSDDQIAVKREQDAKERQNQAALQEALQVSEAMKNVAPMQKAMQGGNGKAA